MMMVIVKHLLEWLLAGELRENLPQWEASN
jgi:hypothetical protein